MQPVSPECATAVAPAFADYMSWRLDCPGLAYAQHPVELPGGWETYTYALQFRAQVALPKPYTQPLVLRIYSCCAGLERARYEFGVQQHLGTLGYPILGHLLLEEDCDYFGGPFLVAPRVTGGTLLDSMLGKIWTIPINATRMANMHARLHQLPTQGFPRPRGAFLTRALQQMAGVVRQHDLQGLRPGLEWLRLHRPPPRRPSILHLDFHPLNLLYDGAGGLVVIDWTEADVGDAHADLGNTMFTLECLSADCLNWFNRWCVDVFRRWFVNSYLACYRSQMKVADDFLTYYRALAALRRLCLYAHWLTVGPTIDGYKRSTMEYLQPDHFHSIERYFEKWTKVPITLQQAADSQSS
jgi:aminoglycoside phosphotransferase (APT) family kinase protein